MATTTPKKVVVKRGYSLKLAGAPAETLQQAKRSETIAALPSQIPFIKPKALVKEGDIVKIGTPLFLDKQDPRVQYLSPGAGTVSAIVYGERRRLDRIEIRLDRDEQHIPFSLFAHDEIAITGREALVAALLERGVWPVLRVQPFGVVPSPDVVPPAVYVSLDQDDVFLPQSQMVLAGKEACLRAGIAALKVLSAKVSVAMRAGNTALASVRDLITHEISGVYPAQSPAVFHYHAKASAAENTAWTLDLAAVIRIGEALITGKYPVSRVITVAGHQQAANGYFDTREGAPVSSFVSEQPATRYVAGSLMSGRKIAVSDYLAFDEYALVTLPEGQEQQFLSFVQPGFDKYSFSRAFLSALLPKKAWTLPTTLNGSHRACIECGACTDVCAVDLYPQMIMKQIEAKDQEAAIVLGMLDCSGCGLCTYVCPSKIEVADIIIQGKAKVLKELRS